MAKGLQNWTVNKLKSIQTEDDYYQLIEEDKQSLTSFVKEMHPYYASNKSKPLSQGEIAIYEELRRLIVLLFCIDKDATKRDMWQTNHTQIAQAMHNHIIKYRTIPNISLLSDKTGFSRTTIYKHLSELKDSDMYKEYIDEFNALIPKVIGQLYALLMMGDVKAGRLLADIMGLTKQNPKNQYIQVNSLTITNDDIQKLSTGKRIEFEQYLYQVFNAEPVKEIAARE